MTTDYLLLAVVICLFITDLFLRDQRKNKKWLWRWYVSKQTI